MDLSKTVHALVGVLVAVLIVATVAIPSITSSQAISDPVTMHNDSGVFMRAAVPGDVLELTSTWDDDVRVDSWVLNGIPISGYQSVSWAAVCVSDGIIVRINSSSNAAPGSIQDLNGSGTYNYLSPTAGTTFVATFTFGEDAISMSIDGSLSTSPYTWAYVATTSEETTHRTSVISTGSAVVESRDDIIVFGAKSLSGGSTVGFVQADGVLKSTQDVDLDVGVSALEGYTGLYRPVVSASVDGTAIETYVVVPYEAHGYKVDGSNSVVLAIIPLLLLIIPVMMAIRLIVGRSD